MARTKDNELELAESLLAASEATREKAEDSSNGAFVKATAATQLYNAAEAYAAWGRSRAHGRWEQAVRFSDNLEAAARFYAAAARLI
jgi:hypothetical protein